MEDEQKNAPLFPKGNQQKRVNLGHEKVRRAPRDGGLSYAQTRAVNEAAGQGGTKAPAPNFLIVAGFGIRICP